MKTTEQRNASQRIRRKENCNADTHKYEKTPQGFLMRKYRNMQSRVTGVQRLKSHLYLGKSLLPRNEFYGWAKSSNTFKELFRVWQNSGYVRKMCPTVDRIDPQEGYELENMRWITHSENSRLGAISRNQKYGNPSK